jgi:site-specific DNA-methyltransferase (cytosine-N4-specific)
VKPFFRSDSNTLYLGHTLDVLASLPSESVNCVITSPPYWGLRAYGTDPQIWGGSRTCNHQWVEFTKYIGGGSGIGSHRTHKAGNGNADRVQNVRHKTSESCPLCGAWRGELGQEHSAKAFIEHLSEVFAQVYRVLHPSGICWINIGDCYDKTKKVGRGKGLALIPQRLAISLSDEQDWIVRTEVAWEKPNACPESMKDRPTSAWEPVWMLSKSEKNWFDLEPLEETATSEEGTRRGRNIWKINTCSVSGHIAPFPPELVRRALLSSCPPGGTVLDPFFGSGTVGRVAQEFGRKAIGIEVNPEFADVAAKRIGQLVLCPA